MAIDWDTPELPPLEVLHAEAEVIGFSVAVREAEVALECLRVWLEIAEAKRDSLAEAVTKA